MVYGINLVCVNPTQEPICRLWDEAGVFETASSMRALNYPAHLTLAVCQEPFSDQEWDTAIDIFQNGGPIDLKFTQVQFFRNEPLVLWLKPERNERLLQLHAVLHEAVGDEKSHTHYRPGSWLPHCTIANKIEKSMAVEAVNWAQNRTVEFTATFDRLDIVSYPPVRILKRTEKA